MTTSTNTLICPTCNGNKIIISEAFENYPETRRNCSNCAATGQVTINPLEIIEIIKGRKGLRSTNPGRSIYGASYVWRMARFHGGIDTHLPVTCFFDIGIGLINNNARKILDILDNLADIVARQYFGTDKAAAIRYKGLYY